jgi:hypothetical protein
MPPALILRNTRDRRSRITNPHANGIPEAPNSPAQDFSISVTGRTARIAVAADYVPTKQTTSIKAEPYENETVHKLSYIQLSRSQQ